MLTQLLGRNSIPAVDDDPAVQKAKSALCAAIAKKDALETEERELIAIALGMRDVSDEQIDAAEHRLSVRKGTTQQWYLEEAQTAREQEKNLRAELKTALAPAKERAIKAGTVQIATLATDLQDALRTTLQLALDIQEVRRRMGEAGVDAIEHPFPALLPGGIIPYQLDLAKQRGLCA